MRFVSSLSLALCGYLAMGQCPNDNSLESSFPDWPSVSVLDMVGFEFNMPAWGLWDGGPSPIADSPAMTDMGGITQLTQTSFTVRHVCDVSEVLAASSDGDLMLQSSVPLNAFEWETTWLFTASDPGTAIVDIALVDDLFQEHLSGHLMFDVEALPTFQLTVNLGDGVSGEPGASGEYIQGTVVDYDYAVDSCFENLGVTIDGGPAASSGQITMNDNHAIAAMADLRAVNVNVTSTSGGSTDADGNNVLDCGDDLSITATPDSGFFFSGWTGDATGSANPLDLVGIDQDLSITANFTPVSNIDLSVDRVEVIQGITMDAVYRVHIADRPTVVRVFVGVAGEPTIDGVQARLTRYVGASPQDSILSDNGPRTLPSTPNEGSLNDTLQFTLPANWLAVGTRYVLELDPNGTVAELNESNNRYPASGSEDFDFQAVNAVDVVIVPVHYQRNGSGPISQPQTSNLNYLTWLPIKVYPTHEVNYTLHAPTTFNGDLRNSAGWSSLLNQITNIANNEDPGQTRVYYGVVNFYDIDGCPGSCQSGLGWRPGRAAIGFSGWGAGTNVASETMTHEIGHNYNRQHAPCGVSSSDPAYPYNLAAIGQWGLDVATMQLKIPGTKDYMSYCDPVWTSDYTYRSIYNRRQVVNYKSSIVVEGYLIQAMIDAHGELSVSPIYQGAAVEVDEESSYEVHARDASGDLLSRWPAELAHMEDGDGGIGLRAVVPFDPEIAFTELVHSGRVIWRSKAGSPPAFDDPEVVVGMDAVEVAWDDLGADVRYLIRYSADGKNWQTIHPDSGQPSIRVPSSLLRSAQQPMLEIEAILGLNRKTMRVQL